MCPCPVRDICGCLQSSAPIANADVNQDTHLLYKMSIQAYFAGWMHLLIVMEMPNQIQSHQLLLITIYLN